jgi:signal transduction histidine kinase
VSAPGFGLGGMRERAELVGAELIVRSGPGTGTEVAVELR